MIIRHSFNTGNFESFWGLPKRLVFEEVSHEALQVAEDVVKDELAKKNGEEWEKFAHELHEVAQISHEELHAGMKKTAAETVHELLSKIPPIKDVNQLKQAAKDAVKIYLEGKSAMITAHHVLHRAHQAHTAVEVVEKGVHAVHTVKKVLGGGAKVVDVAGRAARMEAIVARGACSAAEATELGINVVRLHPTAALLARMAGSAIPIETLSTVSQVARVGSRLIPVVGQVILLADSAYRLQDQTRKLLQMLESDGGLREQAFANIVDHTPAMDTARMQKREDADTNILTQDKPDKFLEGVRSLATRLVLDATDYGKSGQIKDHTKRGFTDNVWHIAEEAAKLPGYGASVLAAGGTADTNTRQSERTALQTSITKCKQVLSDLRQNMAQSPERDATISALSKAIGLAESTIVNDKATGQQDSDEGIAKIREASSIGLKGYMKRGAERMLAALQEAASTSIGDDYLEKRVATFQTLLAAAKTEQEITNLQEAYKAVVGEVNRFLGPSEAPKPEAPKVLPPAVKGEVNKRIMASITAAEKLGKKPGDLSGNIPYNGRIYHFEYRAANKSTTITSMEKSDSTANPPKAKNKNMPNA